MQGAIAKSNGACLICRSLPRSWQRGGLGTVPRMGGRRLRSAVWLQQQRESELNNNVADRTSSLIGSCQPVQAPGSVSSEREDWETKEQDAFQDCWRALDDLLSSGGIETSLALGSVSTPYTVVQAYRGCLYQSSART